MRQFILILEHITIVDILDILIMATVLYPLLVIIRGTRAVQMVLGVMAMIILFSLSLKYRFYTLNWALSHFFDSFFLILIILFQDNIRSALISVGGATLWGKKSESDLEKEVDEIVEAVGALGREKTGAIIVFERGNGLLNYIRSGTQIKSEIHSDIIYTLFQSNSPLHDGAIILSRGKVAAAGCFLPLTKSLEVDRSFGTRHRAAIGVTEGTDAVVVTVSEETGKINLCVGGNYYPIKGTPELRQGLKRHLRV